MLLVALAASPAAAQTLLTNGSQVRVVAQSGDDLSSVNGADGYSVLVPPGATSLVIEFQSTPGTPVELMARNGLDVGIHPLTGNPTYSPDRADHFTMPNNLGMARLVIGPTDHPDHARDLPHRLPAASRRPRF
ncbi:MAG: hypothetical protein R2724_09495 [Bryobacterales bacterium]